MTTRVRWILAICIAAFLAAAVGLASQLRWKETTREVGFHGEARSNSLLAAERLLRELGVETAGQEQLLDAPPSNGVLFWRASGRFAPPMLLDHLREWVSGGGHFVLLLPSGRGSYAQIRDDIEQDRFELPLWDSTGASCELADDAVRDLELDLGFGTRNVRIDREIVIEDVDRVSQFAFPSADSARLVSFEVDDGRMTIVAGDEWIENEHIDERDHAGLAWDLARLHGPPERAWIVRGEQPPGLLTTLARHAWMVIASLALSVALAVWRAAARFGPPIADEPSGRRDFSEHIEAVAEYLSRLGAWGRLVAAPRRRVLRLLQRLRPDLAHLDADERLAALGTLGGLPADRAQRALSDVAPRDSNEFLRTVRDLEQLRKTL